MAILDHFPTKMFNSDNLKKRTNNGPDRQQEHNCNKCDFRAIQNVTLKKHINTMHVESSYSESILSFI